jgi:sodium transport system permease protein
MIDGTIGSSINHIMWLCASFMLFAVAAVLWFAAVRRYHQERLAISG